jgi:hypothetical protein
MSRNRYNFFFGIPKNKNIMVVDTSYKFYHSTILKLQVDELKLFCTNKEDMFLSIGWVSMP